VRQKVRWKRTEATFFVELCLAANLLQHGELGGSGTWRERSVYSIDVGFGQSEIAGPGVFGNVFGAGRLGDREQCGRPHQKSERDLTWSRRVRGGDLLKHAIAVGARPWKAPVSERTVGNDCDAVPLAPRDHSVLYRALLQVVKNLVADQSVPAGNFPCFFKIGHIEVAYAPGENFSLALKLLESRERSLQRMLATPMQEVTIQPVRPEALQRTLAGCYRPAPQSVAGHDFGDQENLIASPVDCLAYDILGDTVKLRSVNVSHAKLYPSA
jgi:hypothetical protein